MGTELQIDVGSLDAPHRRALEELIGHQLAEDQRLTISVTEAKAAPAEGTLPQSLADWTGIYEGLNDQEIEQIDKIIKTRANLTRPLP